MFVFSNENTEVTCIGNWSWLAGNVYISIAVASSMNVPQRIHATVQWNITLCTLSHIQHYNIDQYFYTDSKALWNPKLFVKWTEKLH